MPRATTTSDPFNAIAEPRRREILALLAEQEWPVADIATELDMGQPSVSKHLRVLLDTGLVEVRREGRHAFYRTNPMQIKAIHDWTRRFERYWTSHVLRIKSRAERASSRESTSPPKPTTP